MFLTNEGEVMIESYQQKKRNEAKDKSMDSSPNLMRTVRRKLSAIIIIKYLIPVSKFMELEPLESLV